MFYYTYVLKSDADDNLYTGYTKDLKLRFEQHQKGLVESTKNRRPLILLYLTSMKSRELQHQEKLRQYL